MQTSNQRRRLLKDIESEPFRSWVMLAKCGGGLAVIVLITVIGAGSTDNPEIISRAKDAAPYAPQPAQQHRKQVFDERRARNGNTERQSGNKIEVVDLPKDLPMELL